MARTRNPPPSSPVPDAALDAHIAILGTTGGGKSYTARGLVERLLSAGRRVCILDPVGVWWGLRAAAEGKGDGFAVALVGGEHGDIDLHEGLAVPLAAAVAKSNLPIVIDTSEMGIGERARFLTGFLAELYRVNRAALWLVLEEADEIAPQKPMPDATRLLDAVDRIARRGRSRGFRLVMVSQRPAVLHKNLLTQIRTMIAHRLTAPQDTKAVAEWIKGNASTAEAGQVLSSLPGLETGEAWVWRPETDLLLRERMPRICTYDSSATPDADAPVGPAVGLASIDLTAITSALAADGEEPAAPKREVARKRSAARNNTAPPPAASPPPGMLLGYARVSTEGQSLDAQRDALLAAGVGRIFAEKISGARADRPELRRLLDQIRPGDVVVVTKLDRLARSLADLIATIEAIGAAGAGFRSLGEEIDTTTPAGRLVMHVFAAVAQFERERLAERTREGLAAARRRGRVGGRPRALSAEQEEEARAQLAQGKSLGAVARLFGISRSTVLRIDRGDAQMSHTPDAVLPPPKRGRAPRRPPGRQKA